MISAWLALMLLQTTPAPPSPTNLTDQQRLELAMAQRDLLQAKIQFDAAMMAMREKLTSTQKICSALGKELSEVRLECVDRGAK